jgi:hypothetical protein
MILLRYKLISRMIKSKVVKQAGRVEFGGGGGGFVRRG